MEIPKEIKIQPRHFFPNLNGLRFIGAFMVFVFHAFSLGREIWGDFSKSGWFKGIYTITNKGHIGVSMFFVLSGFLITYLMLSEVRTNGKIRLSNFIARRILRVWPLYFLIVIFGFFIFPLLPYGIETVHAFWRYALFLSNIDEVINGMYDSINFLTATWSVSVEEQFYLSWAALIALLGFRKQRTFLFFFLCIILVTIIFRASNTGNERIVYYHTLSVISDLAIGGLAALLAFKGNIQVFFEQLSRWKIICIYILGALMILLESKIFPGYLFTFQRICFGIFFAFIILEQVYAPKSFFKADSIPGLKRSGEFTYGFYMFHCIFIYYWQQLFIQLGWTQHFYFFGIYLVLTFACTYTASWLSFLYFEKPFLRMKRFFR